MLPKAAVRSSLALVVLSLACADSPNAPVDDALFARDKCDPWPECKDSGKPQPVNYALDFTTDYVQVGDTDVLDLTTSYTLEAWIKPRTVTGIHHVVSKWGGGGNASYSMTVEGGHLLAGVHNGVEPTQVVQSNGLITTDVWQHIAVTMDQGTLRLYINGALDTEYTNSQIPMNSTQPLNFGQEHSLNFTGWSFDGVIDEVRIWNVTRSELQLQHWMDRRLRGREKGLVGYWRFDKGEGTTAFDATQNALDGAIGGATWTTDAAPLR